jgi:Uma2 family endonuclease
MVAVSNIPPGEYVPTADQRVVLGAVEWTGYEIQLALRGEKSSPRIAYLDGVMELMSPSRTHEQIKSYLGALLEAYALERGIELSPYGSWTLKAAPKGAGAEPDECYIVGVDQSPEVPHLVIEVIWTSGGLDKLEIYRRLGVREVWVWRDGALVTHVLDGQVYRSRTVSEVIPGLEPAFLTRFLDHPTLTQAVKALRAALTP